MCLTLKTECISLNDQIGRQHLRHMLSYSLQLWRRKQFGPRGHRNRRIQRIHFFPASCPLYSNPIDALIKPANLSASVSGGLPASALPYNAPRKLLIRLSTEAK